MIKKFAIIVVCAQIICLLVYFASLIELMDPPDIVLLPIWCIIGISGVVEAIFMIAKRTYLPLALVILFFSLIMLVIGGFMILFITM